MEVNTDVRTIYTIYAFLFERLISINCLLSCGSVCYTQNPVVGKRESTNTVYSIRKKIINHH